MNSSIHTPIEYKDWFLANEPDCSELIQQKEEVKKQNELPLISIVIPVYNPPLNILRDTIDSVINQTYCVWELCVSNASLENKKLSKLLIRYARKDKRIRIITLKANNGIAANTNLAIEATTGDYIAFLDHDDLLAPFTLYEVWKAILSRPQADVISSDEDRISADALMRYDPCFRPEFSPDILRNNNYMPHFLVVKKDLGERVGWFRVGYEGAQDHDFILRTTEIAQQIVRIPKVLYHWRAIASSAALTHDAKPYSHLAGHRAISDHLWRIRRYGKVENGHGPNYHKVSYCLYPFQKVSVLIAHYGHSYTNLKFCINSIQEKTEYPNYEIIILDFDSQSSNLREAQFDNSVVPVKIFLTQESPSLSYYSVLNKLASKATGDLLLFIDENSQIFDEDWLSKLVEHAIWSENGAIGGMILYSECDLIYQAGYIVGGENGVIKAYNKFPSEWPGYFGMLKYTRNVSALPITCLMVSKHLFDKLNGFNEAYTQFFGDVDFCIRAMELGKLNVWTPYSKIRFNEEAGTQGQTRESKSEISSDLDLFVKMQSQLLRKGDPFYNPNLSLKSANYEIKSST